MDLLTRDERAWLNAYHAEILAKLVPLLEGRRGVENQETTMEVEMETETKTEVEMEVDRLALAWLRRMCAEV